MTAAWPVDLPEYIQNGSFGETPDRGVASSAPDVGNNYERSRSIIDTAVLTVTFQMTGAQYASFLIFYHDTLVDGVLPFTMNDPRSFTTQKFTFESAPTMRGVNFDTYSVSMTLRRMP